MEKRNALKFLGFIALLFYVIYLHLRCDIRTHQLFSASKMPQDSQNSYSRKPDISSAKTTLKTSLSAQNIRVATTTMTTTTSTPLPNKFLVFVCDGTFLCGGWSDRQRGIVSAYLLSVVTRRHFGIILTRPCDVTQFLEPNEVNWKVSASQLQGLSHTTIVEIDGNVVYDLIKTGDFNQKYPQDVVYLKTNHELGYWLVLAHNPIYSHLLPAWATNQPEASVFSRAWHLLTKPTRAIQQRIAAALDRHGYAQRSHPLACCHVRIGQSENMPDDFPYFKVSRVPLLLNFLLDRVKNGSQVFLATDNNEVKDMARHALGERMWSHDGPILHVDRQISRADACQGFEAAILDQLTFSYCDVLLFAEGSGFSRRAAFLRDKNEELYKYNTNGDICPVRLSDLSKCVGTS